MPFQPKRLVSACAFFGLSAFATFLLTTATMPLGPMIPDGEAAAAASAPEHFWSPQAVAALASEARAAEREGLDPATYAVDDLMRLAGPGPNDALDAAATETALALAHDYAFGRVADRARVDWHIPRDDMDAQDIVLGLERALRDRRLRAWLQGLLPSDPRYAALRAAYATTPAEQRQTRDRLRANLERWRWMPREIGSDYLLVNVPAYRLDLFEDGALFSSHDVIVGKPSTPTPQFTVPARSLVINPWWTVPYSIARHMGGVGGSYVYSGGAIRQRPGPGNALGKVKLDMPNGHDVYLHDTPSKGLFAADTRTFSHGCVRVRNMTDLAADLAELDRGGAGEVQRALGRSGTRTLPFEHLRPVYLVYFTAEPRTDGGIAFHGDPYGRDRPLLAALDRRS